MRVCIQQSLGTGYPRCLLPKWHGAFRSSHPPFSPVCRPTLQSQRHPSITRRAAMSSSPLLGTTLPMAARYKPEQFYPANIGEVFNGRYQALCKIGYGTTSTVWLARDLQTSEGPSAYVSLKIYTNGYVRGDELAVLQHINTVSAETTHPGHQDIRKLLASFEIKGPHGVHMCLVQQALGMSLHGLLQFIPTRSLSLELLKPFLRQCLFGLDFLHTTAGIIHTVNGGSDLQPKNLLFPVDSPLVFSDLEEDEIKNPSARKVLSDRVIYQTKELPRPRRGFPLICDFGEARFMNKDGHPHTDDIMPDLLRPPEVVMRMAWDEKVDIWSIAPLTWHLVSPRPLFDRRNPETGEPDDRFMIAHLGALLGPPPPEFRRRSAVCQSFWDENGKWTDAVPMPELTLEDLSTGIIGENKAGYLQFLRRILRWLPEERPTVRELIVDPWLMEVLERKKAAGG
ncbi:GH08190p [Coccidioides immitis H538.4]|uniref:non-specific serine/threonine protein kinase n=1 Tax=Coccidioides immitis H538.4 TaxID=396776 RepID=A0A0J8S5P3_COCIT|nr:GH08190p [Coccidioides immitis H538.4]